MLDLYAEGKSIVTVDQLNEGMKRQSELRKQAQQTLQALELQLDSEKTRKIRLSNLEGIMLRARSRINDLDFKGRKRFLQALLDEVRVYIDGRVEIRGALNTAEPSLIKELVELDKKIVKRTKKKSGQPVRIPHNKFPAGEDNHSVPLRLVYPVLFLSQQGD